MADSRDPHRFAGKMGIETGPVPLKRWKPQPAVNVNVPRDGDVPAKGGPPKQQKRDMKKE